ncbi:MAG TPA: endonuclease domain-containing protein [bacterium]|nr:endonuclease domain-containing protein [bacterium]
MNFGKEKSKIVRARELRKASTPSEDRLWRILRNRALQGLKFRRQQPIDGYIADFCCFEKRLIIELDGAIHDRENQKEYDQERDRHLTDQGFKVLRFSNDESEEAIVNRILNLANAPSPPAGEGRDYKR